MNQPVITLLDVETFPNLVYTWGLFKQNVGINQIARDWSMASMAWKALGATDVDYADCREHPLDDAPLMERIWTVLDEADIIIAHNGDHFDLRKINARLIELGFKPPRPYRTIDTKKAASKVAMFTSNKLEWLAKHLCPEHAKDSHKEFPGFDLWKECLLGNPRAWDEMRDYNKQDTRALEGVYYKLLPWIPNHPNVGSFDAEATYVSCPKCGSFDLNRRGYALTNTGKYPRFQCNECGSWARGRYTQRTREEAGAILREI